MILIGPILALISRDSQFFAFIFDQLEELIIFWMVLHGFSLFLLMKILLINAKGYGLIIIKVIIVALFKGVIDLFESLNLVRFIF